MKIFFTADTHFGHANIIKYCNRPFADADEMDMALIDNWNSVVSSNDIVYHLGDFAFGSVESVDRVVRQLKFKHIHFIKGNHDKPFLNWFKKMGGKATSTHPSILETKIEGHQFVLCHYAMRVWNQSHRGSLHLFGHSHGTLLDDPNSKSFDIGVDCHNYHPVSLERVLDIMDSKKVETNFENLPGVKAGIIRE